MGLPDVEHFVLVLKEESVVGFLIINSISRKKYFKYGLLSMYVWLPLVNLFAFHHDGKSVPY